MVVAAAAVEVVVVAAAAAVVVVVVINIVPLYTTSSNGKPPKMWTGFPQKRRKEKTTSLYDFSSFADSCPRDLELTSLLTASLAFQNNTYKQLTGKTIGLSLQ